MSNLRTSGKSSMFKIYKLSSSITSKLGSVDEDLLSGTKYFIRFGKIIGILPIRGIFSNDTSSLSYRVCSISSLMSLLIICSLGVNTVIACFGALTNRHENPVELAKSARQTLFYLNGFFLYYYFLRHSEEFCSLFRKWKDLKLHYWQSDKTLLRESTFMAALIMISAILENAVLHVNFFKPSLLAYGNSTDILYEANEWSDLEVYYLKSHPHWKKFVAPNNILALFVFVSNKLALYSWNFADILIGVFSRAIYFRFKTFVDVILRRVEQKTHTIEFWENICEDHLTMCRLLNDFEQFLSPIVFAIFSLNIFFTCMQLFEGLTPSEQSSLISTLYATWSFIHLTGRMLTVTLLATNINFYAHEVGKLLSLWCPTQSYSTVVKRADLRINTGNELIGLTGLKCFTLNRPFILNILASVFTIEIVFLQTHSSRDGGID